MKRCLASPASWLLAIPVGFWVFTVDALEHDRGLLAHEFVHVAQYERFQMFGFMRRYIFQCLADGYLEAPMEIEARELSDRLLEA